MMRTGELCVSQVVRLRFTPAELGEIERLILRSIALRYPLAAKDEACRTWYSGLMRSWVNAIDEAVPVFGLSSRNVREIIASIQVAYHNALVERKDENGARRGAILIAHLYFEKFLNLLSP